MITPSSLDEIANYLEQHENSKRIKKLIFCACKNIWENDQDTLDKFQFQKLIQELYNSNPTIDKLNAKLSSVVNTLNKPGEYSFVANLIVNEIQKLYLTSDEATGIISNSSHQEEATGIISNQSIQNRTELPQPKKISANNIQQSPQNLVKSQHYQFDLRQNIMKYTNPLRAKIIIFSVLEHKFTFNEEDWFKLKAEELDSLLQRLFNFCPTIRELESKLNAAVISLGNPDENNQTVGAIIQCMRNLYSNPLISVNPYESLNNYSSPATKPVANSNNQIGLADVDEYIHDENEDSTCQIIVPPTKEINNK